MQLDWETMMQIRRSITIQRKIPEHKKIGDVSIYQICMMYYDNISSFEFIHRFP